MLALNCQDNLLKVKNESLETYEKRERLLITMIQQQLEEIRKGLNS